MKYEQLDEVSHYLKRPDTYIGSTKLITKDEYTFNSDNIIEKKNITYNAGLLRLFIEALSNAIDNKWRSDQHNISCKKIVINVDSKTGKTSIWNDGFTIKVEKHQNTDIYIPELIFGHFRTSSNYNDNEDRLTSGRNGIGSKAINIYSDYFQIKLVDTLTNQKYEQSWSDHMRIIGKPSITKSKLKSGYTEVTWTPDFKYFNVNGYTPEFVNLMKKYAFDAAMITGLTVIFNEEKLTSKTIVQYAKAYFPDNTELVRFTSSNSEVVVTSSKGYDAISFVNGILTKEGGIHVDQWVEAIFRPIITKFKKKITLKDIKPYFTIFINSTLVNPCFDSQTKDKLVSPSPDVQVSSNGIKNIMSWKFIEFVKQELEQKELMKLKKTERKTKSFKKIKGLDPANNAGTKHAPKCSLILCEGLSAKTYAVSGIQVGAFGLKGRDWFGIYPLRGTPLNVRNCNLQRIANNSEISDIIQALGLKYNTDYTIDSNFKTLRYGKVIILADADHDGLHINALIINFFHYLFPTLFQRKEAFIFNMKTPIVRIQKKNEELIFYNQLRFNKYMKNNLNNNSIPGKIRYLKGLGTSSTKEIKETFGKKVVTYILDSNAMNNLNKMFHKDYTLQRKLLIEAYDPTWIDNDSRVDELDNIKISDFIHYDLIEFSIEDCKRSIPSIVDGLKESQRKILYAVFLKNLKYSGQSMKVAQLAGFVAEKTNYHHGEQCLNETIIKMAQDFVGSNNIPLLYPDGQFGSKVAQGKDAASARYIFTKINNLTRLIFKKEDDNVLQYRIDDGDQVEPIFYVPIVPMILVNGSVGIGTGYSCKIPSFNPLEIIHNIYNYLDNVPLKNMIPWYNGFKGKIIQEDSNKFKCEGIHKIDKNKIIISEIPVDISIDKYKEHLEDLLENKQIKSLKNYSTPINIHFEITLNETDIPLKLRSDISTTNMVAFNKDGKLTHYKCPLEIIKDFCQVRLELYKKRKEHLLENIKAEIKILSNKYKFIKEIIKGTLIVYNRPLQNVITDLHSLDLKKHENSFDYLLNLSVRNFTEEKVLELHSQIKLLKKQLRHIEETSERQMWKQELKELEKSL